MQADREYLRVLISNPPGEPFFLPREYVSIHGYSLDPNYSGNRAAEIRKFDNNNESIIVKKYCYTDHIPTDNIRLILRELNMLRSMNHANIIRGIDKYAIYHTDSPRTPKTPEQIDAIYHITEFCGEPLTDIINRGQYEMRHVKHWSRQQLSALQYIHSLGICHRDLCPENMCINPTDMKLTLLGFKESRVLHDEENTQQRGNEYYQALEMQRKMTKTYNEKVDIFSMAVVLCELLTGRVLFAARDGQVVSVLNQMVDIFGPVDDIVLNRMTDADRTAMVLLGAGKMRQEMREFLGTTALGQRVILPQDIDNEPELNDFLRTTLAYNPDDRLTADKASCHPFLYTGELPVERKVPTDADAEGARRRALLENLLEEIRT